MGVPGHRRRAAALATGVLASALSLPALAHAAPAVTTTNDSAAPGSGSLRAAIGAATPGATINVPASSTPYKVSLGEIPITVAIHIQGTGSGPSATVIEATGPSRVFHVTSAVPSTTISTLKELTITKGSTTASPGGGGILVSSGGLSLDHVAMTGNSASVGSGANDQGGGAINTVGGDLTITSSSLTDNSATIGGGGADSEDGGGAILSHGSGAISITNSTINSNHTSVDNARCCDGGAVYQDAKAPITITGSHLDGNQFTETDGTACCSGGGALYQDQPHDVTIRSSTLNRDKATVTDTSCCDGGGAFMFNSDSPQLTIDRSAFVADQAVVTTTACCAGGGAINTLAASTITNSTFTSDSADVTDNSCCDGGGAIQFDNGPNLTLTGSELSHNSTRVTTSATGTLSCCQGGGALSFDSASGLLAVDSSDVSDNQATSNSSVLSGGGGIYAYLPGGGTFVNSTLSGNTATGVSGSDGGGGLFSDHGDVALSFTTIAGNGTNGAGGGVWQNASQATFKNSIVALNTATNGGGNCDGMDSSPDATAGHNLESSPDSCNLVGTGDKIVPASSIKLGPLANNGGPTLTRELLPGSPAIDAVPLSVCSDQTPLLGAPVHFDQRGVARPQPTGGSCDIGAYEFGKANVSLSGKASPATVKLGKKSTLKFTVTDAGPVPATDTKVTFTLPSGVKFVSGAGCKATGGAVSCPVGAVGDGKPVSGSIVISASKLGKLKIHAKASATEPDPVPSGNSRTFTLTVKGPAPTLKHVSQSHSRWREGSKAASLARKHKTPPIGTTFSLTLNEKAKVTFTFTHKGKARGHVSFSAHKGANKVSFDGVVSGGHKLSLGRYTVSITARAGGEKSKPAKLTFTIVG